MHFKPNDTFNKRKTSIQKFKLKSGTFSSVHLFAPASNVRYGKQCKTKKTKSAKKKEENLSEIKRREKSIKNAAFIIQWLKCASER